MNNLYNTIKPYKNTQIIMTIKGNNQCYHCGCDILESENQEIDGNFYCKDCLKELFVECEECQEWIVKEEITEIDGNFYCDDCTSEHFYYCDECQEYFSHSSSDLIYVEDNLFCCAECANKADFFYCADCDTWFKNENNYEDNNGNIICKRCSENYITCENCDDIIHTDCAYYSENTDCYYCESCFREIENENRLLHDYNYIPDTIYYKMEWENTLYLGIELELELDEDKNINETLENVQTWLKNNNLTDMVYFKQDSSLNHGVEFVFYPFTLQSLHKKFKMNEFLKYLLTLGFRGYNDTCGLHIHLSRKHFKNDFSHSSEENLHKMKIFFYVCESFLKSFSKRKNFHFCNFDETYPDKQNANEHGHYSALNLDTGKPTIEIRIFRSTLNYERILASFQFCDSLANYIKTISLKKLKDLNKNTLWIDFLEYSKQSTRYSHFIKYIFKHKII